MTISKKNDKLLYVQLGRDETRFAMSGGPDAPKLTLQTPAGAVGDGVIQSVEAVRAMIKSALQQPEFKGCRKVVFSLCTSQVITETVTTPELPAKRLEKLLLANVDMYFPVDMAEYKLVWQVIGPKGGDTKEQLVQLWAVPTAMLSRYYQVANACNLLVERIDYCGNSFAAAVGASFTKPVKAKDRPKERAKLSLNTEITFGKKKQAEEPVAAEEPAPVRRQVHTQLHVLLESDMLGITFVQEGQVMLQRFVRCGANPTHQFDELAMMVEYFGSLEVGRGSTISGFVCGGLAENAAMVAELADTLNIPMQVFDGGYEPKWTLCAGAAASSLEFGIPALNVMKAGRQVESQLWQYVLMLATGLVLVGVVLLQMTSRLTWQNEKSRLETQQQTLLVELKKTSGYADKYDKYISEYNKYSSDWDTIFASLRTYNDNLVLALEELEATLPENTSVTGLQISADGLTVQFACSSKEEAAYLIMALRKMEYMELVAMSNLSGGGGGAADSFGPSQDQNQGGDNGTEAPPTEGSYGDLSDAQIEMLTTLLAANMDQAEVMKVFMGLSDSELERLENVYGNKPQNKYSSLAAVRSANATRVDFLEKRRAALNEMLTTNPFAIRRFADMVMDDVWAPDPILWWNIYDELMLPENTDLMEMLMSGSVGSDAEKSYEMLNRLLKILTKDEETVTATEDLMATDSKMERWYIYYLEIELGHQKKTPMGFLNMDRVIADLMEGSFDTGDKNLDKKLNALVPKEVWTALKQIGNQSGNGNGNGNENPDPNYKKGPEDYSKAELLGFIYQYTQNGKTDDTYINQLINNYLTSGSTGDDRWDEWIKPYEQYLKKENNGELPNPPDPNGKKPTDYQQSELMSMLYKYLNTGTTGDKYLDGLIDNYLMTGTTGDADWDEWLEPYKQYLPGANGGGSNSAGKYPYYITVALKYKDTLKDAELDRKGLDKDAKIEKIEVGD